MFADLALRDTLKLRLFAWLKIPLVAYLRPTLVRLDDDGAVMRIPFGRRARNHVGSMYFGTLAIGADAVIGALAIRLIRASGERVMFVFKDFQADFHKRADGDVHFHFDEAEPLKQVLQETIATGERCEAPLHCRALVPDRYGDEPVATFRLTISMKRLS